MADTLPQLTQEMNDNFLQTWMDMRPDIVNNIVEKNIVWALLREKGMFKPKDGGEYCKTKGIKYANPSSTSIDKTDTLPSGTTPTKTMARWAWRYETIPVQRNILEDAENSGPDKLRDYVADRMEDAVEGMQQTYETNLFAARDTNETGKGTLGLHDILPPYASRNVGLHGGISRTNAWWQCNYKQKTGDPEVYLLDDWRNLYNTCGQNQSNPDIVLTTQTLFEVYENYAEDKSQIIINDGGIASLGFDVRKYKGADLVWSPNVTAGDAMFLNSMYIEYVYNNKLWFEMGDWKPGQLSTQLIAHIFAAGTLCSYQPRRFGLYYA